MLKVCWSRKTSANPNKTQPFPVTLSFLPGLSGVKHYQLQPEQIASLVNECCRLKLTGMISSLTSDIHASALGSFMHVYRTVYIVHIMNHDISNTSDTSAPSRPRFQLPRLTTELPHAVAATAFLGKTKTSLDVWKFQKQVRWKYGFYRYF